MSRLFMTPSIQSGLFLLSVLLIFIEVEEFFDAFYCFGIFFAKFF